MTRFGIVITFIAVLFGTAVDAGEPKKLLLLAQGPDGHPKGTHEYQLGLKILQRILKQVPDLETRLVMADEPWREGPKLLADADGVVIFLETGARFVNKTPARLKAFQDLAKRKGAFVGLHWGIGTREAENIKPYVELVGGCHGGPKRKYKVLSTALTVADPKSPIANGLKSFKARDEFYYRLKVAKGIQPFLRADIDGESETVAWSWERPDGGRSFGFSGLHFHDNWRMPEYRRFVSQGVLWTMRFPIPKKGIDVMFKAK